MPLMAMTAPTATVLGLQARIDDIKDVGIFPTFERQTIDLKQIASVLEPNGAVYEETTTRWLPSLQTTVGLLALRARHFGESSLVEAGASCRLRCALRRASYCPGSL